MTGSLVRVIGLDLSLTSTGMADGTFSQVIQTSPTERLEERLDRIVRAVVSFALSPARWTDDFPLNYSADLAVIEAPAWSKVSGVGHEELSALRVMVRHRLWRLSIPYALVPPTTLKMATTGYGKATKQQMVAAVDARHMTGLADVMVKDGRYDRADAIALAAMGYAHVGQPLPCAAAPPIGPQSLAAVSWPDLLSD